MTVSVIGTGYVGLVTGACLADSGNEIVCVDIDKTKVELLQSGGVPIYEPGLAELIERNKEDGRIEFTTDIKRGVEHADIIFIAVGTPMSDTGEANLSYVFSVARDIGKYMNSYKVIVDKSTVPVGTADKVRQLIKSETEHEFDVVSNPEFLKEGTAISDFMKPDRVVVGGESKRALELMRELYEPFLRTFHPLIVMDTRSAEMTKYAANCFLATKISFINEMSNLCERAGADIAAVREGIGADRRIGYEFLFPGVGYGGSCFPKDVQALIHTGETLGYDTQLMKAVEAVNYAQKSVLVSKVREHVRRLRGTERLDGLVVGMWGLSFKPQTDDMREAPSIVVASELINLGATITAFDPEAIEEAKKHLGNSIKYAKNMYEAIEGADILVLMTEWNEFRRPSWNRVKSAMRGDAVFDGRNIYDPKCMREAGFTYYGMGRK